MTGMIHDGLGKFDTGLCPFAEKTVEFDRPNRVALESSSGLAKIKDTMSFAPSETGSTVTYDANIEMKSLAKV